MTNVIAESGGGDKGTPPGPASETTSAPSTGVSREVSALLTFKGGIVCSVGNGKVAVVNVQAQKDADELKLKVVDLIRLPLRNASSAGTYVC